MKQEKKKKETQPPHVIFKIKKQREKKWKESEKQKHFIYIGTVI